MRQVNVKRRDNAIYTVVRVLKGFAASENTVETYRWQISEFMT